MLTKYIILDAIKTIGGDRSISSIYHMMKGKTSIQTIQDAKLYKLENLFGIYKQFPRQQYFILILDFEKNGFIIERQENTYVITELGQMWLQQHQLLKETSYFNGKAYQQLDKKFFFRLQLLIQVWTNAKRSNRNYIPIIEDKETAQWVKQFYKRTYKKIDIYLKQVYAELKTLLIRLPSETAEMFVGQLTSFNDIGKTIDQLAYDYNIPREEVYLLTVNALHYCLDQILKDSEQFPLLFLLLPDIKEMNTVTQSARITKQYLDQGLSLKDIAAKRTLKVNTIYDHIVELAMADAAFPVKHFVSEEMEERIVSAANRLQTYKLKDIKDAVGDDVSYFQLRLVIARMNHAYEGIF